MASERLFGTNIRPACRYCEHVMQFIDDDKMLCKKRGVVLATHKCRAFIYDPTKRIPQKPKSLEKFEKTEFAI